MAVFECQDELAVRPEVAKVTRRCDFFRQLAWVSLQ